MQGVTLDATGTTDMRFPFKSSHVVGKMKHKQLKSKALKTSNNSIQVTQVTQAKPDWLLSQSILDAVTKCRLDSLQTTNLFLIVLTRGWEVQDQEASMVRQGSSSWFIAGTFLPCPYIVEGTEYLSGASSIRH